MVKTVGQVIPDDVLKELFDATPSYSCYSVYKNNRKATKALFNNYEEARQFVRKKLRKEYKWRVNGQPWMFSYPSPTLGFFVIKRITS